MTRPDHLPSPQGQIDRIARALAAPGRTPSTDYDLAPELRAALPKNRKLRPAAVLIPLLPGPAGLRVLLTRRSVALKHHPGQIAFPGGKVDATDASDEAAALREAREEVGLDASRVRLIGRLGAHETVTGFSVVPIVGQVEPPFTPAPSDDEVAEVFDVPLSHLLDPANLQVHSRIWMGRPRAYFAIPYGPYYIWGATARIIKGLADQLAEAAP